MVVDDSLKGRLLFAIPKKGRLHQACLELLEGSDLKFRRPDREDIALVTNLPLAIIFLPAGDIPTFVGEGSVDLGITGRDQVAEHEVIKPPTETTGASHIMDLGFGKCKLQVQVPEDGSLARPEQLVGKRVATSFENLTKHYFRDFEAKESSSQANGTTGNELRTEIKRVGGSVESTCKLRVADGIVDLVESGNTMRAAGLKAIATVLESEAILISSKQPSDPDLVKKIAARIEGVITAKRYVLCTYNVSRDLLAKVREVTPGKRAPTITSLEEESWVAVQAMVERDKIADAMDKLFELGATDILVTKIVNSRMT